MKELNHMQEPGLTFNEADYEAPTRQSDRQRIQELQAQLALARTDLAQLQLQTQAMHNSLGEGLITTDNHGRISMINAYAMKALGFEEDELVGQWFPRKIVAVDKNSRPIEPLSRPIIRALTSGQTASDYMHYVKQDGSLIPVLVTVSPIMINDRPTGAIEVFRDLTKERQLDVAKDEFVSLASHQLRTPATAVMMILSMLAKGDFGPLTDTQHRYLEKAITSNQRQLQIIEDLLNAARVDAGKMRLDLEYTDLVPLIRESIADQVTANAMARNQSIRFQGPSRCQVMIDPHKLRMVIDNLLSNASKYSRRGTEIGIKLEQRAAYATITITDQGVGMTPDQLTRLFTKFTRFENELSASVGGTGLGLFLAKGIVELHGGRIIAMSQPGLGSTFAVQLPRQPEVN